MKTKKTVLAVLLGLAAVTVPVYGAMASDSPSSPSATESGQATTYDLFDLFTMSPEQLARALYASTPDF